MHKSKHILIIRLSAMGDVTMIVPVLRAFVQKYPEVKITMLTKGFFKPFFRDIPNVSVFEADLKGKHKGLLGLWRLAKELNQLNVDAVADFHNVLRTKILKFFFNFFACLPTSSILGNVRQGEKVVQIDKGRSEKRALTNGRQFQQLKSTHQRYADVLDKLGYPVVFSNPKFPKRQPLDPQLTNFIGKDAKRWIGIAPFAAYKGKMYPIDLMEKVVDQLAQTHKVLLFGAGNEETLLLKKISEKKIQVIHLADQFSLSQELDIISNLDLMIAMDSANAHIAAMLGIEVVTLWGVTHPYAGFYPFNQDKSNAILADRRQYPQIPTSVYGHKFPQGYENVMRSISPEKIVAKVNGVLGR